MFKARRAEFQVNTEVRNWQFDPVTAPVKDGGFVIVWTDDSRTGTDVDALEIRAQRFDASGAKLGSEFVVNTRFEGDQQEPAVAGLAGGGYVIIWSSRESNGELQVRAQLFTDVGDRIGGEFIVNQTTDSSHRNAQVTALADGGFAVMFQEITLTTSEIKTQFFSAAGQPIGQETLISSPAYSFESQAKIATLSSVAVIVVWAEVGDYFTVVRRLNGQVLDPTGAKQGVRFTIDGGADNGDTFMPAIAALPTGGFVVSWTDTSGDWYDVVKAQVFDANSAKVGGELLVTPAGRGGDDAAVTALPNGNFVIAYNDHTHGGTASSTVPQIRAQLFDASGSPIGAEFVIGLGSDNYDNTPDLITLASGDLGAAYGSRTEIMAQVITPSIVGTAGPDTINGTIDADAILGGNGNDLLSGLAQDDNLDGNSGNDMLDGGDGNDVLRGGLGDDRLEGGSGADTLNGDAGDDRLFGGDGDDNLSSWNEWSDELHGEEGNDVFNISPRPSSEGDPASRDPEFPVTYGRVLATGGLGNDEFYIGGAGHYHQSFTIALDGGAGADLFYFNQPFFTTTVITLGSGSDTLWFSLAYSAELTTTVVTDFQTGLGGDRINLKELLPYELIGWDRSSNPFASGYLRIVQAGDDTMLKVDRDAAGAGHELQTLVTLKSVNAKTLTAENLSGYSPPVNLILTGTDGTDTLIGGAGDDVLDGGAGDDTLTVGQGNDRADGGTGRDTLYADFGASATGVNTSDQSGTPDGVTRDGAGGFGGSYGNGVDAGVAFVGIETVYLTGSDFADRLATGDGHDEIYAGGGDDFVSGGGGSDFIWGGAGSDVMQGGAGGDEYVVEDAGDVIIEQAGDEGVDFVQTTLATYVLAANVEDLFGGAGSAQDLRGNGLDNVIEVETNNNFIRLQDGGDDTVVGGVGNDILYFRSAFTADDKVNGGRGADVLALQGSYSGLTFGAASLVDIETLSPLTGSDARFGDAAGNRYSYNLRSIDANVAAGAKLIVNGAALLAGEGLTFNGTAETDGNFFIYGGRGIDILTGGAKVDIFFLAEGRFGAGDRFAGGAGADILILRGDYAGLSAAVFTAETITGIETISLLSASDTRFFSGGTTYSYAVTFNDGNVAAGAVLTVNGGHLRAGEVMTFDGSAETDGAYRLFAGSAADALTGGAGGDLLYGGLGADVLTGGGGADVLRYQTAAESTAAAPDRILDFASGDIIDLSRIDADTANGAGNDTFSFIGANAFGNRAGELRVASDGAGGTFIEGDVDGDGLRDLVIFVDTMNDLPPVATDFLL